MKTPIKVLEQLRRMVDWGTGGIKISWENATGTFCVITIKGCMSWSGIGQPWTYSPTRHWLCDCRKADDSLGYELRNKVKVGKEIEGRLTKAALAQLKEGIV